MKNYSTSACSPCGILQSCNRKPFSDFFLALCEFCFPNFLPLILILAAVPDFSPLPQQPKSLYTLIGVRFNPSPLLFPAGGWPDWDRQTFHTTQEEIRWIIDESDGAKLPCNFFAMHPNYFLEAEVNSGKYENQYFFFLHWQTSGNFPLLSFPHLFNLLFRPSFGPNI